MLRYLIVIDMQNDFVTGSLGTEEAVQIVPNVVKKINEFDGTVFATMDTHTGGYLNTMEGRNLPVKHCEFGTEGHKVNPEVYDALCRKNATYIQKSAFGSSALPNRFLSDFIEDNAMFDGKDASIEIIGLCTDICVISNALILKSWFHEAEIYVDAKCCAGTTPEMHNKALDVMQSCQIKVYGRDI